MEIFQKSKKFWNWLWHSDSYSSLIVLLILAYIFIKFIFFPVMSFITNSEQALFIVESCSMNHKGIFNFESWWAEQGNWYEERGFTKEDFKGYAFNHGLKMGDIVLLWNRNKLNLGEVIVFKTSNKKPLIHRIISLEPLATKGDFNSMQLTQGNNIYKIDETNISRKNVIGKAVLKIPRLGWAKLIFVKIYELLKGVPQEAWC